MVVAMHGHSRVDDPNQFATPDSFAAAMKMSPYFKVNLDIGHFTAANFDALAFIREHHADITNLHLKDMKRNQGDYTPWGQGDAPIRETLQLLKRERWPIRAYIEYEYRGAGTPVEEVKKCHAYATQALRG
jgi:sugar phosphate isomerase/epimerase